MNLCLASVVLIECWESMSMSWHPITGPSFLGIVGLLALVMRGCVFSVVGSANCIVLSFLNYNDVNSIRLKYGN